MDKNNKTLEEPAAEYGWNLRAEEIVFQPMTNMMESLRSQGYITHDELVNRLSKYL